MPIRGCRNLGRNSLPTNIAVAIDEPPTTAAAILVANRSSIRAGLPPLDDAQNSFCCFVCATPTILLERGPPVTAVHAASSYLGEDFR